MGTKPKKEKAIAAAPDPARSVGRLIGLSVGMTVGLSAATAGLVSGVPAPDLLLRALCAGVLFKVIGGWCGATLARSLLQTPDANASPRTDGDR